MDTPSKQALIELLFLTLYQDGHLSIEEDSVLEKALNALGWTEDGDDGISVGTAFSVVREAGSDELKSYEFLKSRTTALREAGHSATALEWVGKVLASDGMSGEENTYFARVEKMLIG